MTRIANAERAPYRSELRERQAAETRDRILDAVVRVMARGVAELSIPAVAREAGVSVPTVYRHFGSKRGLLAEIQPHFARRAGLERMRLPESHGELRDAVRALFGRIHGMGDLVYAALASPLGRQARHLRMPERLRANRAAVDTLAPQLTDEDRDRLARLMVVLTSSSSLRTWTEYLHLAPEEAADDVAWAVRAIAAGAGQGESAA
jgi:AcrR family transcriptional regulator